MSDAPPPLRSNARLLLAALTLIAAVVAAPAQAATWKLEPIGSSEGVVELQDLGFDGQGRGLLSWNGVPPGLATRGPGGNWERPRDAGAVLPATTQIHVAGTTTLLVAREGPTDANLRRLVFADGKADGSFGALTPLDDFVSTHWSAANAGGDAIVAWKGERTPFLRVGERAAGQDFADARELAIGQTAAVAINDRGDRVLAWRAGKRLAARVRPAGGEWGATERFGRITAIHSLRLNALIARNGRVVLTWGSTGRACGVSVRHGAGRWMTRTLERRCGPMSNSRVAPVLGLSDTRGATYVAWTGRTRTRRRAVKFARVGGGGSVRPIVLSREPGAVLDDVAAGPGRALVVTYAAPRPTRANPLLVSTFAALRRGGGSFQHDRLTPPGFAATRGSRVAFQPVRGEPVVAVPFLIGLNVAVGAAVGPAAP